MSPTDVGILLVEDDPATADLYLMKLRMDGFTVHHATDAAMAHVIFNRSHPGVACVDTRLPDESGAITAGWLAVRGARVILLTNDQASYEAPPASVRVALLKSHTTPAMLSAAITQMLEGIANTGQAQQG